MGGVAPRFLARALWVALESNRYLGRVRPETVGYDRRLRRLRGTLQDIHSGKFKFS
jgi:hypothetical protein